MVRIFFRHSHAWGFQAWLSYAGMEATVKDPGQGISDPLKKPGGNELFG